jgi:hypothetical protein
LWRHAPLCRIAPIVYLIRTLPKTQKGYVVRPIIVVVIAALLTPATLAARPLASGLTSASTITDISAAKKKKKPAKVKEEYLKAAPGAGPSGPTK